MRILRSTWIPAALSSIRSFVLLLRYRIASSDENVLDSGFDNSVTPFSNRLEDGPGSKVTNKLAPEAGFEAPKTG